MQLTWPWLHVYLAVSSHYTFRNSAPPDVGQSSGPTLLRIYRSIGIRRPILPFHTFFASIQARSFFPLTSMDALSVCARQGIRRETYFPQPPGNSTTQS